MNSDWHSSCKLGPSEIREVFRELKLVRPLSNVRGSHSIGTFNQERMQSQKEAFQELETLVE